MSSRGFAGAYVDVDTDTAVANMVVHPASLSEARRNGFGMTALRKQGRIAALEERAKAESELNTAPSPAPTPDRSPEGRDAETKVFQECQRKRAEANTAGLAEVADTYRAEVLNESTIRHALSDWRECMADAGFPIESLSQLASELSSTHQPHAAAYITTMSDLERAAYDDEFLSRESEAAVATVRCDQKVLRNAFTRWKDLEDRWMDEHADLVRTGPVAGKYFLSITLDL